MSLLSYNRLCELVEQGVITNVEHDQINATSIDLTLGENVLYERLHPTAHTMIHRGIQQRITRVSLSDRTPLFMGPHNLEQDGAFLLLPGRFMLAQSAQTFNLPNNISAEYFIRSAIAPTIRAGVMTANIS